MVNLSVMKPILYFQSPAKTSTPEKLAGVRTICAKLGWQAQIVEKKPTRRTIAELIDFWSPLGAIIDCGLDYHSIDPLLFRDLPSVFLCHDPNTLSSTACAVFNDQTAIGRLAARELLSIGFTNFAFLPFHKPRDWSRGREQAFVHAIRLHGHSCSVFAGHGLKALRDFLVSLPKPCAVFAANDRIAIDALAAAQSAALNVPEDLALLGVDNYQPICESVTPALSSIEPDFHHGGELATLMLAANLREGRKFRGPRHQFFGPLRIVARASTHRPILHDKEVESALALIRTQACEGLSADEVCRSFTCSRRSAIQHFRAATGHSILEEIHTVRLERCKELVRSGIPLKAIHDFCGFPSANTLRRFFLRKTGQTLSDYRANPRQ